MATVAEKIVKKETPQIQVEKVEKEEIVVEREDYNKNFLLRDDFLVDIEIIKKDIDQFTPWILNYASSYDILDFFDNFINLELVDYSDEENDLDDTFELE